MADFAKTILVAGGSLYIVLALGAVLFSDALLFPVAPRSYSIPGLIRIPSAAGDEIAVLHLRNPSARFTLLHSHGNGEDLESLLPALEEYRRRGFSVLAYDYPGYGLSSGSPSEQGVYAAVDSCYRHLTEERSIKPADIVLYGRSLGAGAAVDLAARTHVAGLIVEGGFVSAFRVMTRLRILPWDKFDNERKIRRVDCPVWIVQAANDQVVGYWHGPRLAAAAKEPKSFWRVEGAGHNDLIASSGEEYWARLQAFTAGLTQSVETRNVGVVDDAARSR